MSQPICCICGNPCEPWPTGDDPPHGYGHNPWPFGREGDRCCNTCNDTDVIQARINRLRREDR